MPALAVAEALRASGAEVEFAGGDRAEAELVPAAGFPFHRLEVEGIDRRNPLRAAQGAAAGAARHGPGAADAARHRRRRRARRRRLRGRAGGARGADACGFRCVLTEADSHLGVTNRLLAPFARRVFLAFPIEGREGPKFEVAGRPVPAGTGSADRAAARERFGVGEDVPVPAGVRRLAGRPAPQRGRPRRVRRRRPVRGAARGGPARSRRSRGAPRGAGLAAALPPARLRGAVRRRPGGRRPGGCASRGLGARGGRGGAAVDPRPLPARHGRPPDRERPPHGGGGRRRGGARRRARRPPAGPRGGRAAARARADARDGERGSVGGQARRRRADRRGAAQSDSQRDPQAAGRRGEPGA